MLSTKPPWTQPQPSWTHLGSFSATLAVWAPTRMPPWALGADQGGEDDAGPQITELWVPRASWSSITHCPGHTEVTLREPVLGHRDTSVSPPGVSLQPHPTLLCRREASGASRLPWQRRKFPQKSLQGGREGKRGGKRGGKRRGTPSQASPAPHVCPQQLWEDATAALVAISAPSWQHHRASGTLPGPALPALAPPGHPDPWQRELEGAPAIKPQYFGSEGVGARQDELGGVCPQCQGPCKSLGV